MIERPSGLFTFTEMILDEINKSRCLVFKIDAHDPAEFNKDENNFKNCANKFNMNDVYIDIEETIDSGKNVDYDNKDVSGLAQIPR